MFPLETIEKILSLCDGKTLYNARNVSEDWRQIVDYLTERTKIWTFCCNEEIPPDQLIEYLEKYNALPSDDLYREIYNNWIAWQSIKDNIIFDVLLCPAEIPRITCIASSGRFIAVGSEDGKVRLYNDSWSLLYTTRHVAVRVVNISFFDDGRDLFLGNVWPILIVFYKCNALYLVDYETRNPDPFIVYDVKLYSVYKRHICLVKTGGRISVVEWKRNAEGEQKLQENTYVRIYSPNELTGISIWDGICTCLVSSDVKTLQYDLQPVTTVEKKTRLKFCIKNDIRLEQTCQIYRRNIIISLSNDKRQVMELFLLGKSQEYSKKLFHPWEALEAYITCMFLYGNTFILGVDVGDIYIYNVDSWKTFDIRNFQEKLRIGKHPIISIDAVEKKGERKFFVASSFNIHRVIGFSITKF